jgi:hypothetical protein
MSAIISTIKTVQKTSFLATGLFLLLNFFEDGEEKIFLAFILANFLHFEEKKVFFLSLF